MRQVVQSFNAGELTPLVDSRSDVDKYGSGCRLLRNMIPRIYGCAERRGGFKHVTTAYSNSYISRMEEFEYSDSVVYSMEFSQYIIRFMKDQAILQSGGIDVTVATPYAASEIYELQFNQLNDVVWITHPNHPPYKLTRTTSVTFSMDKIVFYKGPFQVRNNIAYDDGVTLTPSVVTGTGTLTSSSASKPGFTSDHIGCKFQLIQPRLLTTIKGKATTTGVVGSAIPVFGQFSFTTHGYWTGVVALERLADGANWETFRSWKSVNGDRNIQITEAEYEDDVQYRVNVTEYTLGPINVDFTVNDSTQAGICEITAVTSSQIASMTVLDDFASATATTRWAQGSWSAATGYPRAFCFFEQRGFYGGAGSDGSGPEPQTIWGSRTGDYEYFREGTLDDDSFSIVAASKKRNGILWMSSLDSLVFGTTGGEWVVKTSLLKQPLTPTNCSVKQQSNRGSATIDSIQIGDSILFIDKVGRKVRQMVYSDSEAKYIAPDLTALAEHITQSGITSIAYQRYPDGIVWMTLADGSLVSLTLDLEQNVIAAAKHTLGGTDAKAKSVCVLTGQSGEDEIWINTTRTINGSTVQHIEVSQPRDWGSDDEDQFFLDDAIKYDGVSTSTITGLGHLEGETVSVLADGAVQSSKTVSSAQITLDRPASVVIVGLPPTYTLKAMRQDERTGEGNTLGTTKKASEVVINFYKTGLAKYGKDANSLSLIKWRTTESYDTPTSLFTGSKVVVYDHGYSSEDEIIITGDSPLNCSIRSLVIRNKITGR